MAERQEQKSKTKRTGGAGSHRSPETGGFQGRSAWLVSVPPTDRQPDLLYYKADRSHHLECPQIPNIKPNLAASTPALPLELTEGSSLPSKALSSIWSHDPMPPPTLWLVFSLQHLPLSRDSFGSPFPPRTLGPLQIHFVMLFPVQPNTFSQLNTLSTLQSTALRFLPTTKPLKHSQQNDP